MITIGITGSFASGKTFILDYLAKKGYAVFNADREVEKLYEQAEVVKKVLKIFPELNFIDKAFIADVIYDNDVKRKALEDLIFPYVRRKLALFRRNHHKNDLIFAELPLLFEAGFEEFFDFIIAVKAPANVRKARALGRSQKQYLLFEKINNIQMDDEEKCARAHYVIDSSIDEQSAIEQINEIVERLK